MEESVGWQKKIDTNLENFISQIEVSLKGF